MKKVVFAFILFSLPMHFFSVGFSVEDFPLDEKVASSSPLQRLTEDVLLRLESNKAVLEFLTDANGVEVYFDSVFAGRADLVLDDVTPGLHRVKFQKPGFSDKEFLVDAEAGTKKTFRIKMDGERGILDFETVPEKSEIYINGQLLEGTSAELPTGAHGVEVRKFGYNSAKGTVYSRGNIRRKVKITLDEAKFSVSKLKFSSRHFTAAGIASKKLRVTFCVSAPGHGRIKILNEEGSAIFEKTFSQFSSEKQEFIWDGTQNGLSPREGNYTVDLEFQSATDDEEIFTAKETIIIGKETAHAMVSVNTGGTSLGAVSSARLCPLQTTIFSFSLAPALGLPQNEFASMPINVAFLFTPLPFLEIHGQLGAILTGANSCGALIAASVKGGGEFQFENCNLFLAGLLRYAFISEEFSSSLSEGGLGLGVMSELKAGAFTANIQAEYVFAPKTGIFTAFDGMFTFGTFLRGQGRIFGGGPWCKVGVDFDGLRKIATGGELFLFLPSENIIKLGFGAITENFDRWLLQGELGITVIF